jgi:hypothetical protein
MSEATQMIADGAAAVGEHLGLSWMWWIVAYLVIRLVSSTRPKCGR